MRIIAGQAKGVKLQSIPGLNTRPSSDRVKEALFNILGPAIYGSSFLDLYAGNGGIGLEALSRGAAEVIWVDSNRACTTMIKENRRTAKLNGGEIYTNDVFQALNLLVQKECHFDYIFLDPPYEKGLIAQTLEQLAGLPLLKRNGLIIAEASKKEDAPANMSKLTFMRSKKYGNTLLYFYQWEEAVK